MPDDHPTLDAVADELYGVLPSEFIAARNARFKVARSADDEGLAASIKALRKPSAAAWLINLLARSGLDDLGDVAQRMRDAQANLDAQTMKDVGHERSRVVTELVDRAVALAKDEDPSFRDSDAVRDQVTATLVAAVADPGAEAAVTSGRLVSPLSDAGVGEVDLTDAVATPLHVVREKPEKKPAKAKQQDTRALEKARDELERAEDALEEAEQTFDEARARRHEARLEVKRAQQAVDELEES